MINISLSIFLSKYYFNINQDDLTTKTDIQSIVCEVLGVDKTHLYINQDLSIDTCQVSILENKIARLIGGEPLAYIIGYQYFWEQKLLVTKNTLIPRADTEIIVQSVLDDILDTNAKLNILDLGTGTGSIALALAGELPNSQITAVDLSADALIVAKQNGILNNISNVEFVQSSWYESLGYQQFDIIVSNPPYIDYQDDDIYLNVKSYEPELALFADDNGLADIVTIISDAKQHIKTSGRVYIEHGYTQGSHVRDIFINNGFENVETIQDLNGLDRCTNGVMR